MKMRLPFRRFREGATFFEQKKGVALGVSSIIFRGYASESCFTTSYSSDFITLWDKAEKILIKSIENFK